MSQRLASNRDQSAKIASVVSLANAAAVVTIAADPNHVWKLLRIIYSYNAAPTVVGQLTVQIGATTHVLGYVSAAGTGQLTFDSDTPLHGTAKNEAIVITLPTPGTAKFGTLFVQYV